MPQLISLFDIQPILQPLKGGQLLLTPNQRLASRVSAAYAIHCAEGAAGAVVDSPRVRALGSWLDECWRQLLLQGAAVAISNTVLSALQEQVLWENIVADSDLGAALLRPAATARQVSSAYRTLVEWQQPLDSPALVELFGKDEDSAVLLQWIKQFEVQCRSRDWLPSVRRAQAVIDAFDRGELVAPGTIVGIAFESIAPLYKQLLASAGTLQALAPGARAQRIRVCPCESSQRELQAAALWAKQLLRDQPSATVAIVIPDLVQQRQQVQRTLQEVFETDFNHLTEPGGPATLRHRKSLPFNLSAGYPLIEAPIISAALDILALQLPAMDLDTLESIVQSPFLGANNMVAGAELECRVQLITLLRRERQASLSPARFRQLADRAAAVHGSDAESVPWAFAIALQQQANYCREGAVSGRRSPQAWRDVFQLLLTGTDVGLDWPGQRSLDSIEYQQLAQWQLLMETFSSLQLVLSSGPQLSYSEALVYLRAAAAAHVFQPESVDSPLQVLGTLEAAGLQFSHLWLMSMADHQWPPAPSPNPLLPKSLQRSAAMPHSSAERELEFARDVSDRFLRSADQVVISFAENTDAGPAAVSALFESYERVSVLELLGAAVEQRLPTGELRRRFLESSKVESIALERAPPVLPGELVKGGSSLFASQSACPFRAFSAHRLGLKALEQPDIGLSAAERGSLLHRALELVWETLKSKAVLLSYSATELERLCTDSASYAVQELVLRKTDNRLGKRFQQLEIKRLTQLLVGWLAIEKERADFTVEALEQRNTFRFNHLELEMRIDRVDRLADNSLLIIDYKTGVANINRWWGERPDEPQLPLYSMLAEKEGNEQVGGIAFAQLRVDGTALMGAGADNSAEEKIRWRDKMQSDSGALDWPQLKSNWLRVLSALAQDFIAGNVVIDPKKQPASCQYCDYSAVCRINHREYSQ
jgi:ATP-dependent helicase/nuclease subunit B